MPGAQLILLLDLPDELARRLSEIADGQSLTLDELIVEVMASALQRLELAPLKDCD